jgi:HEAT repeat protein
MNRNTRYWRTLCAVGAIATGTTILVAQPPATQPPVAQSPVAQPPATPSEGSKGKEKEPTYPTEVNGRDLNWYLKETSFKVQPDPQQRESAVRTIPAFGPSARRPAIDPVTNAIYDDPDPGVKIAAITIISNMGFDLRSEVKKSITAITTALNKSGPGDALRMYSVRSISSFGPDAVGAVKNLRSISNDPSWETRLAIAEALGSIGAPGKKDADPDLLAAKTLLDYLVPDKCMAVRLEAVKSLLTIGPPKSKTPDEYKKEIKPYLESLEKRLEFEKGKSGDRCVYVWLLVLQIMYDDRMMGENIKKIAKMIETPEGPNAPLARLYALQALGVLGKPAAPAVPQIVSALAYPEQPLQMAAMVSLARIGNDARAAIPELEKIKAKLPVKPIDAPADWKPDDTMQKMASDTIDYITGKKKIEDARPEDKKDDKPGEKK